MTQQVIIEFMELMGMRVIDFDDLLVKMSPHSHPNKVTKLEIDTRVVKVEVDGEVKEFDGLSEPIRQTIIQRMRLMYHNYQKA
jgi:hypothetical protein